MTSLPDATRLAQVLAQHNCDSLTESCQFQLRPFSYKGAQRSYLKPCPQLLRELATARQPDREALVKLLARHTHQLGLGHCGAECEELLAELQNWAQGTPQVPVWCKHMEIVEPEGRRDKRLQHRLKMIGGGHDYGIEHWEFCPYCATPRPGA